MQRKFFGYLTLIDDFDEQIEKLRFGADLTQPKDRWEFFVGFIKFP